MLHTLIPFCGYIEKIAIGSKPFFTVDHQVFRHGPPPCDELADISFFHLYTMFLLFFVFFYMKSAAIFTFYVNSSHVIYIYYICPHYAYVAQNFCVDVMY